MIHPTQTLRAVIRTEPLVGPDDPSDVLAALAAQPGAVLLDSAATGSPWGRYSIAACRPIETLTLRDDALADSSGRPWPGAMVEKLRRAFGAVRAGASPDAPYAPGWLGYLGYELGRHFERLPAMAKRDTSLPDAMLGFYDAIAIHDAQAGRWTLAWLDFESAPSRAGEAGEALRDILANAASDAGLTPATGTHPPAWTSNFSPAQYVRAVGRCVEYIRAGDIFQVNLSQRFTARVSADPVSMYRALRRRNAASHAGYIGGDGWAVLSSSPELFLRCRGGQVVTRPIKGTRRRIGDPHADARAAKELLASPKDNAELAMIIDLLRNDLGRVCRYGSVRVINPRELEAHPTVLHLVGTVVGRLADGRDLADLLAATFPGGSITGAPKIRAMEIIDEMEPCARGVYTGSLAHFGVDGSAELSIAIRSAVWDGGAVHVQAGGGIVADSSLQAEYDETLDKARALLEAVEAAQNGATTGNRAAGVQ